MRVCHLEVYEASGNGGLPVARPVQKETAEPRNQGDEEMASIDQKRSTVVPYLVAKDAAGAAAFYQKAFGAEVVSRLECPKTGVLVHADLKIGDALIWLGEENPNWGSQGPTTLGGTPVTVNLNVPDADKSFTRAISAGATALKPVEEMFWGARFGQLRDPFGHQWSVTTQVREVSPDEMQAAFARMMEAQA
jgi:uncharacterized glyoxalase superfamily protein PhnB